MGNRARRFAIAASVVLLCLSVALFLSGYITNAWNHRVSLTPTFHIGVWNTGVDSRLVFFNDAEYGPYRGSIVGLSGDEYPHTRGFGDTLGIYYRHFTWPDSVLWTLAVSLWYPILLFSVCPCWRFVAYYRRNAA